MVVDYKARLQTVKFYSNSFSRIKNFSKKNKQKINRYYNRYVKSATLQDRPYIIKYQAIFHFTVTNPKTNKKTKHFQKSAFLKSDSVEELVTDIKQEIINKYKDSDLVIQFTRVELLRVKVSSGENGRAEIKRKKIRNIRY